MVHLLIRSFIFCIILSVIGCFGIEKGKAFEHVAPGNWRGVFVVESEKIPVTFDVNSTKEGQPTDFTFFNGEEQLKSDKLKFWGDTVYAYFNEAQSYLRLVYEVNLMEGHWFDETGKNYPIAFQAQNAVSHRFPDVRTAPVANITGTWNVKAIVEQDSSINAQLRIAVDGNKATGNILLDTTTRIPLEGTVQGAKVYLSGFNGQYICMFSANIADENALFEGKLFINNQSMFCTAQAMAGVE